MTDNNYSVNPVDKNFRGAKLPYIEMMAKDGKTNGTLIGPSTELYDIASEAVTRMAVKLIEKGGYVEWIAPTDANTIVVRYCIPDNETGTGRNTKLGLYINDKHDLDLDLTSKYAWIYGDFPWTKDPSKGKPHKFFDEVHTFVSGIKKGDKVKLQWDSADMDYCIIDLIDFENVAPPKQMPEHHLSVIEFGAVPNSEIDSTEAFVKCIDAAKAAGKAVWIPEGVFHIDCIHIENATVRGAGMWHSILTGSLSRFNCEGDNCRFYDFAVFGDTNFRDDMSPTENSFNGWPGKDSVLDGIWVEHKKCAFWVGEQDAPYPIDNLQIRNCRFRNLMADAVNFCNGTSNSVVENTHCRFTGDDSLATWSKNTNGACCNNVFRNNTIQTPWLASGIAIYGGSNHTVEYNEISNNITGGSGIYISSNFYAIPLNGTMTIRGNTMMRCGSNECYTFSVPGSIRVLALHSDIDKVKIEFTDNDIFDAVQHGISFQGPLAMSNVIFKDMRIDGCASYGMHIDSIAKGSASFEAVSVKNAGIAGIQNDAGENFVVIKKGENNTGW